MANPTDKLLIALGFDTTGLDAGAAEAIAKTQAINPQLAGAGETAGGAWGKGFVKSMKLLRKDMAFIGAYLGSILGSEMGDSFGKTSKSILQGVVNGALTGAWMSRSPWGAVIGGGIGGIGAAVGAISERNSDIKNMERSFKLSHEAAKELYAATERIGKGETLTKGFENLIKLLDEARKGSKAAREELEKLGIKDLWKDDKTISDQYVNKLRAEKSIVNQYKMGLAIGKEPEDIDKWMGRGNLSFWDKTKLWLSGMPLYNIAEEIDRRTHQVYEDMGSKEANVEVARKEHLKEAGKKIMTTKVQDDIYDTASLIEKKRILLKLHGEELDKINHTKMSGIERIKSDERLYEIGMKLKNVNKEILESSKEIRENDEARTKTTEAINDLDRKEFNRSSGVWGIEEMAGLGGWKREEITGPWTQAGAQNIEASRQILNAEGWAKRNALEGYYEAAQNNMKWADNMRWIMTGVMPSREYQQQHLKLTQDLLSIFEAGNAKVQILGGVPNN